MVTTVKDIAEKVRQEPFSILSLKGNCLSKSIRFKELCRRADVEARVVISIGWVDIELLGFKIPLPRIHAWGEVDGTRIEVAAPLDMIRVLGYCDIDIKPMLAIWV